MANGAATQQKQQKWKTLRNGLNQLATYQLYQQQTMVAKMSQRLAYSIENNAEKSSDIFKSYALNLMDLAH